MVTIETERLILRQFSEADVEPYRLIFADDETRVWIGGGPPRTYDEMWRAVATFLGHWVMRGYGPFAVQERSSGKLVGHVGPWDPAGWPELELIWTIDRAFWGRGFAPEAARAARHFTYALLGPTRLISLIVPENARSLRVADKLGATFEREIEFRGKPAGVYLHPV